MRSVGLVDRESDGQLGFALLEDGTARVGDFADLGLREFELGQEDLGLLLVSCQSEGDDAPESRTGT